MLELAKNLLNNGYDAHKVMEILVSGGLESLEAAKILVEILTPNSKIKMQEITIIWHEGTGEFDDFVTDNWNHFNSILEIIATQHGSSRGYSKTKFQVTWQDGYTYEGRLDVNTKDDKNVGQHIKEELDFCTGDCKPDHMSDEQYKDFLTPEGQQAARDFLNEYEIIV
jgi:hypothetical protein